MALSLRVLVPIKEAKEVLINKNVLNMTNTAYPDETPRFAAPHLGLRYW